jgi:UDP-galactopyranose mutase
MAYDFLLVGCGIHNITLARILTDAGKSVRIIEKRSHIGGNCYDVEKEGILVHPYGIHAFHTPSKEVWDFLNRFTTFNHYQHRVKSYHRGVVYSFPPNRALFDRFATDDRGKVFDAFFAPYSSKQWGVLPPPEVINRIPWRTDYNDNYFNDRYQGMPIGGYTKMFERMLDGIDVQLKTSFDPEIDKATKIIYTGDIAKLVGKSLPYRSLRFRLEKVENNDYQGCAQMNFPDKEFDFTRNIEFKHLYFGDDKPYTYIQKEFPFQTGSSDEPFYPIAGNDTIYKEIKDEVAKKYPNIIPAGRLGTYKYLDMSPTILSAMSLAQRLLNEQRGTS